MKWRAKLVIAAAALGLALLAAGACSSSAPAQRHSAAVILRSALPHDTHPGVSDADYQTLIDDNTRFAFDLYAQLVVQNKGNLVFSPLSTSVALAMAYAGARGETAKQMAAALHFELPQAKLHPAFDRLALELASRNVVPDDGGFGGNRSVSLDLANELWIQRGLEVVPGYLDTLASDYGAGVGVVDFSGDPDGARTTINDWVSQQTHDRITNLLAPGTVGPGTPLVLTDALYLEASWEDRFDKSGTAPAVFHTLSGGDVDVPTMHRTGNMAYAQGNGYQVVDLPYYEYGLSMRIILPAAGRFAGIRGGLSLTWLQNVDQAIGTAAVAVSLPRFKFGWGATSFKHALENLGMTDAFTGAADFTGMVTGELSISDVLHKAYVSVDESGTEAAAATAVTTLSADASAPTQVTDFDVDRPFIFLIRDHDGSLLFVGQVTNPVG